MKLRKVSGSHLTERMKAMGVTGMIHYPDDVLWHAYFEGYGEYLFALPEPVSAWLLEKNGS